MTLLVLLGTTDPAGLPRRFATVARDGGEVVHVHLDRPREDGDVVLLADAAPTSALPADARFAVLCGPDGMTGWRRVGTDWVATEVLGTAAGTLARNTGILETSALADRSVAIVGLGSGGSLIADQLARAGVGHLVLIDRDRIEVENVGRHLCDLTDLGRRKTVAMRDRLLARNPALRADIVDIDVLADPEALRDAVVGCHVLVGATDGNASRRVVNSLALTSGRPAVFGRAYTRACGGDVIRVVPGGPCYDCLFGAVDVEEEVATLRSAGVPAYADRPVAVEPGLALDIAPIAQMCARLVLQELVRGRGSALESLDDDLPGALFLWANRREGSFADWKPMRFGMGELAVMRWYGMRAARSPTCPTCNEDAFLERLLAQAEPSLGAHR